MLKFSDIILARFMGDGRPVMKKLVDDIGLIYKCCKMYYEDRLSQHQIADQLGISRVTVSRMLSAGRKMGIVRIQVVEPEETNCGGTVSGDSFQ